MRSPSKPASAVQPAAEGHVQKVDNAVDAAVGDSAARGIGIGIIGIVALVGQSEATVYKL